MRQNLRPLSKPFFQSSASFKTRRLSSDWESTRLKIELSPVQIREAAYSEFTCPKDNATRPGVCQGVVGVTDSDPDSEGTSPGENGEKKVETTVRHHVSTS